MEMFATPHARIINYHKQMGNGENSKAVKIIILYVPASIIPRLSGHGQDAQQRTSEG